MGGAKKNIHQCTIVVAGLSLFGGWGVETLLRRQFFETS